MSRRLNGSSHRRLDGACDTWSCTELSQYFSELSYFPLSIHSQAALNLMQPHASPSTTTFLAPKYNIKTRQFFLLVVNSAAFLFPQQCAFSLPPLRTHGWRLRLISSCVWSYRHLAVPPDRPSERDIPCSSGTERAAGESRPGEVTWHGGHIPYQGSRSRRHGGGRGQKPQADDLRTPAGKRRLAGSRRTSSRTGGRRGRRGGVGRDLRE